MNNQINYKIGLYPEDVLFFRSGASFDSGLDNFVASVFPPSNSVIYGALQSMAYQAFGIQEGEYWPDPTLRIKHLSLNLCEAKKETLLYPIPSDLIVGEQGDKLKVFDYLQVSSSAGLVAYQFSTGGNRKQVLIPHANKSGFDSYKKLNRANIYLDANGLSDYLAGKIPDVLYRITDYVLPEIRTGIGREKNVRIVEEGKLYRIQLLRMRGSKISDPERLVSFYVELETDRSNYLSEQHHIIKLGGERKLAQVRPTAVETPIRGTEDTLESNGIIKAYMFTQFAPVDGPEIADFWKELGCEFLTFCAEREHFISGWDMQKGHPKGTFKTVPPGAVYFLRVIDNNKLQAFIHQQLGSALQISDKYLASGEFSSMGQGLFYLSKLIKS